MLCLTLPSLWSRLLGGAAKIGLVLLKHPASGCGGSLEIGGTLETNARSFFFQALNSCWYNFTILCDGKGQKFAPEPWLG